MGKLAVGVLASIIVTLMAAASAASPITVNTMADNTTGGDGLCTLREAIANVNAATDTTSADCAAGSSSGDTIVFSLTPPARIKLAPVLGELTIARDVTIVGPAFGSLAIDGRGKIRVFRITAGSASISNLTVQRGRSFPSGGGILVEGGATLDITNCVIMSNQTTGGYGGGIEVTGTAHLTNCLVEGNKAAVLFGGDGGAGGGLDIPGAATLTDCVLSGNKATGHPGGIGGVGGAIAISGTATLTNCILNDNKATGELAFGGAVLVDWTGSATLLNCTLDRNKATEGWGGGAVVDGTATFTNSALTRNEVTHGGRGGALDIGGTALLDNCVIDGNKASGLYPNGGGVDVENEGSATLTGCTLSRNKVTGGGWGGGIAIQGTAKLTNSTFSGNKAIGIGLGGGIMVGSILGPASSLTNCTLDGNRAPGGTGGGIALDAGTLIVENTIVANSGKAGNCDEEMPISNGHNLSTDSSCFVAGSTDIVDIDAHLAPLASEGGVTKTIALCTGVHLPAASCAGTSPAIDAGDDAVTGPPMNLTTDQRGLLRAAGAHVDIGAYEAQ